MLKKADRGNRSLSTYLAKRVTNTQIATIARSLIRVEYTDEGGSDEDSKECLFVYLSNDGSQDEYDDDADYPGDHYYARTSLCKLFTTKTHF